MSDTTYQRSPDAVQMSVDDTLIVVDPATNQMLTLNSVAGLIWDVLAEPSDVEALVEACRTQYTDVEIDQLRRDVVAFVQHAGELGVLELADA